MSLVAPRRLRELFQAPRFTSLRVVQRGVRLRLTVKRTPNQRNENSSQDRELFLSLLAIPKQIIVGRAIASECLFLEHQRQLRVFEWTFEEPRADAWL